MLCLACVPLPGYGAELDQSSGLQYVQPHLMMQEIEVWCLRRSRRNGVFDNGVPNMSFRQSIFWATRICKINIVVPNLGLANQIFLILIRALIYFSTTEGQPKKCERNKIYDFLYLAITT